MEAAQAGHKPKNLIIPNAFQTPNTLVDDVMRYLTGDEYKVLVFAVRHILGWQSTIQKRSGSISLTMLEKGYTSGNRHFGGTGLNRKTIINILESLVSFKLLVKVGKPSPRGQKYQIGDDPDYAKMEARTEQKSESAKRKMAKLRKAKAEKETQTADGGVSHTPVYDIHRGGVSHTPVGGVSHTLNQSHIKPVVKTNLSSDDESEGEKPEKPARKPNVLMDAVCKVWSIQPGGHAGNIIALLKGTAKSGKWKEHRIVDGPVVMPQEVLGFGMWWKAEYPDANLPQKPDSIASNYELFRAKQVHDQFVVKGEQALRRMYPTEDAAPEQGDVQAPPDQITPDQLRAIKAQRKEQDDAA